MTTNETAVGQVKALVEKVLNSRSEKGYWKNKAVEEALAWGEGKARELKVKVDGLRQFAQSKADEVYSVKGLNDRGQKA